MVIVTWLDAQTSEDRWTPVPEVSTALRRIQSIGWLVAEDKDAYAIAQDLDLDEPEGPWANTVGTIPKGCVVSVVELQRVPPGP